MRILLLPVLILMGFLTVLTGVARADNILIYHGGVSQRGGGNGGTSSTPSREYLLVDVDTHKLVTVTYSSTKADGKKFDVTSPVDFFLNSVNFSAHGTESRFFTNGAFTLTGSNHTFSELVVTYTGLNSATAENYGGIFQGQYPKLLKFTGNFVLQTGVAPNAGYATASASLPLSLPLTRASNEAVDTLPTATTMVTDLLVKQGYSN